MYCIAILILNQFIIIIIIIIIILDLSPFNLCVLFYFLFLSISSSFVISSFFLYLEILIRCHIGSTQECGVVLKLEMFSYLSIRYFRLGSPIGLEVLRSFHWCFY